MPEHSDSPPALRRTRLVCISDTHNNTVKLPQGDVLIHAGDLTNQGSFSELSRTVAWIENAPFESRIVVAGNHDVSLDKAFYAQQRHRFRGDANHSSDECLALLAANPAITYLCHESATVCLKSAEGPHTKFTVFGSPYSPKYGTWAFGYEGSDAASSEYPFLSAGTHLNNQHVPTAQNLWAAIPPNADVVVTHTPPYLHHDWSAARGKAVGCEQLRRALWAVRPRLAVCGHVHEGRGAERVRWNVLCGRSVDTLYGCEHGEEIGNVDEWEDPGAGQGNKKMSYIDMTSRRGRQALENDGSTHVEFHHGQRVMRAGQGRRESLIVNCAIVATSYPHTGGKILNKPVVVDLDLPVWEE